MEEENEVKEPRTEKGPKGGLAIFETFKSGTGITGEASRQRSILSILAGRTGPSEKTRTGIAKRIAKEHETPWKNIYSGIFRDMDEILLPGGMVEEDGRLPLKRGPKALQEKGIPYYRLTRRGMLAALAIPGTDMPELLAAFFKGAEQAETEYEGALTGLAGACPGLAHMILGRYVRTFCDGGMDDLLPFDPARIREAHDESLKVQREALEGLLSLPKQERDRAVGFLKAIT